jgi:hypothetical protein
MDVGARGAKSLAFSYNQTRENVGANIYNNGFTNSSPYLGGDGQPLFSASHPTQGGTSSNTLAVAADLSEVSVENLLIQIGQATDPRGNKINLKVKTLIIPVQLEFEAKRLLGGTERPGTADRDINAMHDLRSFPNGWQINHYLSDPDAFFIRTDLPDAIRYFERRAPQFENDNDFTTENMLFKCTGRFVFGWSDWRSVWGSPGA